MLWDKSSFYLFSLTLFLAQYNVSSYLCTCTVCCGFKSGFTYDDKYIVAIDEGYFLSKYRSLKRV